MSDRIPDPMRPEIFRVRRVRHETEDTFTLEMEPASRAGEFRFVPGQFNMLYVFGVGEIPVSISGDPAEPDRLFHTTRAVGIVTKAMRRLRRGDAVGVRGPFGSNWPVREAQGSDVVLVAGGIGLAPLRPALCRLTSQRERFGRVVLLYGTRSPADILFEGDLDQWRARSELGVHVTVDRAMGGWRGNVGVVTSMISKAPFDPGQTMAFVCGPEVMMRFAALELEKRGVPAENIHVLVERNMKCAVGLCGHCQFGPHLICKDGPVFRYDHIRELLAVREV
jgi:NAD(P)H-flavin reductase